MFVLMFMIEKYGAEAAKKFSGLMLVFKLLRHYTAILLSQLLNTVTPK